jgi:hypothetical protein
MESEDKNLKLLVVESQYAIGRPRIFIWLPVEFFKQIKIRKSYPTEAAAVDCALEAERKWIDQGKPELFPEKCDGDIIHPVTPGASVTS